MEDGIRKQARERYAGSCGYCGVHEDDAGATLTIDHHRPRAHGGDEDVDNLVYACSRCNEHKGPYWHEKHAPHVRLLHPGLDQMTSHLRVEVNGHVTAITPEGAFFIHRLRLNRPQLIAYRQGLRERRILREKLTAMMEHARALEQRVNDLGIEIDVAADEIDGDGP